MAGMLLTPTPLPEHKRTYPTCRSSRKMLQVHTRLFCVLSLVCSGTDSSFWMDGAEEFKPHWRFAGAVVAIPWSTIQAVNGFPSDPSITFHAQVLCSAVLRCDSLA